MTKHIVLIHGTWCSGKTWGEFVPALEQLGLTVHTPSLRYHDLPFDDVKEKVGAVSLRDYVQDTVAYMQQLDEAPLVLGHSLGCLIAQLVAEQTETAGLILLGPAPTADIFAFYPTMVWCFAKHFLQWGFWKKPMPPYKNAFFNYCMNAQEEAIKQPIFDQLVPESGLVYTQMALPFLDKEKNATVDFTKINVPVLVVTGTQDKMTVSAIARKTAKNHKQSTLVTINGADHMYTAGKYMNQTVVTIEAWLNSQFCNKQ